MTTCIVWLRKDLRLHDNPALFYAVKEFDSIIPVYIHDDNFGGHHKIGAASKCWLYHSLKAFQKNAPLIIRKGDYGEELEKLLHETKASCAYVNKSYDPELKALDKSLDDKFSMKFFEANLLVPPGSLLNKSGEPFKVFTPFWKSSLQHIEENEQPVLDSVKYKISTDIKSTSVDGLGLLPNNLDWPENMMKNWKCGENAALSKFHKFAEENIYNYYEDRNFPNVDGVSKMSPHLAFGEISVRYMRKYILDKCRGNTDKNQKGVTHYISELGWREFSYNLLHFFPNLPTQNFKQNFDEFEWAKNSKHLEAWQQGLTGFPIVDAGMRELWHTGYIHNRVRMIVGSFLVKDLHIDWQEGEQWFWDTLVDADIASNTASWQWVAGSGADAAPYFRIFNPTLQSKKFDANGDYIKRWLPELAKLDSEYIHEPHTAPPMFLNSAGITIGKNYPKPIVNHKTEREIAMQKYKKIKS